MITTAPGEEGLVDYGDGPMVRHPQTGKYRRTRLFVLTLSYSRKAVRLLVWHSSTQVWAELHERAFRRIGGTVRVIILDNLKEGVLTPDIYDPALNPLYRDVLAHQGAVALPCRVGDPDRKGKVEAGVGHAKKTPLRGLRFESLDEAQAYLDRWEAHIVLSATQADGMATLSVSDSGGGIAPEHLPHVFERFYKVDAARASESTGSGLGLSITKAIIERHGGTIRVTSQPGRTTFTVQLPQSS